MRNRSFICLAFVAAAAITTPLPAQVTAAGLEQVRDDAKVIARIAEVADKDLPRDLMRTIVSEDIDILRGKQNDGTYLYASYVADEAGRREKGFTVPAGEKLVQLNVKGQASYAALLKLPSRRYLVRRNQQVFVERVDLEITPAASGRSVEREVVEVGTWLAPGSERLITFPQIARASSVTVHARTDKEAGPASFEIVLLEPRLSDDPLSPWYRPVENAKVLLREIERRDKEKIASAARLIVNDPLLTTPSYPETTARREPWVSPTLGPDSVPSQNEDLYLELRRIEELLSGNEFDRRQGMDMLRQTVRRLRPAL